MNVSTGYMDEGDEVPKERQFDISATDINATNVPGAIKLGTTMFGKSNLFANIVVEDFINRQQAVQSVAKANPDNIQEVAASQLSIINSYYQSGLEQSQRSFQWSLIWGSIGLVFFIAAVTFLLIRQPTEVAFASGIGGAIVEVIAGTYLYLYKHASDQLAAFRTSLETTQRLLLANSMCEMLEGEIKQKTRADLISLMVQSATNLATNEK
jgi:hypothetical protein